MYLNNFSIQPFLMNYNTSWIDLLGFRKKNQTKSSSDISEERCLRLGVEWFSQYLIGLFKKGGLIRGVLNDLGWTLVDECCKIGLFLLECNTGSEDCCILSCADGFSTVHFGIDSTGTSLPSTWLVKTKLICKNQTK